MGMLDGGLQRRTTIRKPALRGSGGGGEAGRAWPAVAGLCRGRP